MIKRKMSRFYKFSLLGIVILSASLRIRGLTFQSFWVDELARASAGLYATWEEAIPGGGLGGLGWAIFRWESFWIGKILGFEELNLRLYPVICGVILIALVAEIGRELHGEIAGLVAASILCISKTSVKYSQEFGPYASGCVIVWLTFFLLIRKKSSSQKWDLAIVILSSYAIWLHTHSAAIVIIGSNAILASRILDYFKRHRMNDLETDSISNYRTDMRLLFLLNTSFLLRIPGFILVTADDSHSSWIPDYSVSQSIDVAMWWYFSSIGSLNQIAIYLMILGVLVAWVHHKQFNSESLYRKPELILWSVGPIFLILLALYSDFFRPAFHERYILFALPSFCLIFGVLVSKFCELANTLSERKTIDQSWPAILVCSIIISTGLQGLSESGYYTTERKSDFRGMVSYIDSINDEGNSLLISQPTGLYWDVYFEWSGSGNRVNHGNWDSSVSPYGYSLVNSTESKDVFYMVGHSKDRFVDEDFLAFLEENYTLIDSKEFYQGQVWYFSEVI